MSASGASAETYISAAIGPTTRRSLSIGAVSKVTTSSRSAQLAVVVGARLRGVRIFDRPRGVGHERAEAASTAAASRQASRPGRPGIGTPSSTSVRRDGPGQRPAVGLAPGVLAHHEGPHRRLAVHAVVEPAHVVVHEAQDHLVVVDGGGGAERALAGAGLLLRACPSARRAPRARAAASCARPSGRARAARKPEEVRDRALRAVGLVVPAREVQHRRAHAAVAARAAPPSPTRDRPAGWRSHSKRYGATSRNSSTACERAAAAGRSRGARSHSARASSPRARAGQAAAHAHVGRDVVPDPGRPRHVEHAAGVEEVARRGEGHGRHHGLEVRRRLHRGQPLHGARIGQAERAHRRRRTTAAPPPTRWCRSRRALRCGRARTRLPSRSGRARPATTTA